MKKLLIIFLLISNICIAQRMQMFQTMTKQSDHVSKVISEANRNGYKPFSGDVENAFRKFDNSFLNHGLFAKGDIMHVFNGDGSKELTDINFISPLSFKSTRVNNPKWNSYEGTYSNGIDTYVNLNWAPTNGVNFTQNSAETVVYYSNLPTVFNTQLADGSRDAPSTKQANINVQNSSGTTVSNINMSSSSTTFTDAQFNLIDGMYLYGRNSSSNTYIRKGTATQQTAVVTSSAPTAFNQYLGVLNDGGTPNASSWNNRTVGLYWCGAALTTTEETNFVSDYSTLLSDLATAKSKLTVGTIYNVNSWANLSDFSNNGSTCSVISNALSFSGGAGTFTQTLDLFTSTVKDTKLAKWKMVGLFKVGTKVSNSNGFGLGIRSSNTTLGAKIDAVGRFNMTNGAGAGQIIMNTGSAHTASLTSTDAVSFSVNDVISLTVELNEDVLTIDAYNTTTGLPAIPVHLRFTYPATPGSNIPNTGRFAIYSIGGSFTCTSLTVSTDEWKFPKLAIIGDSKTQYYRASQQHKSWGYLLQDAVHYPIVIDAGGSDGSAEYVAHVNDLINIVHPSTVIIEGISNDIRAGVASGTWQSNISSVVSTLQGAGITVLLSTGIYETSVSQAAYPTWVNANYSSGIVLDYVANVVSLNADNIHPNDAGHATHESDILGSGKIPN